MLKWCWWTHCWTHCWTHFGTCLLSRVCEIFASASRKKRCPLPRVPSIDRYMDQLPILNWKEPLMSTLLLLLFFFLSFVLALSFSFAVWETKVSYSSFITSVSATSLSWKCVPHAMVFLMASADINNLSQQTRTWWYSSKKCFSVYTFNVWKCQKAGHNSTYQHVLSEFEYNLT